MKKILSVILTIVMLLQTAVMAVPMAVENDAAERQVPEYVPTLLTSEVGDAKGRIEDLKKLFPSGSFFSVNGKACSHTSSGTCSNCNLVNVLQRDDLKDYRFSDGGSWTCLGFAKFAWYFIHGKVWSGSYDVIIDKGTPNKDFFSQALPGDMIYFFNGSDGFEHAAIFCEASDSSAVVYHANTGGVPNKVTCGSWSYSSMSSNYGSGTYARLLRIKGYVDTYTITYNANGGTVSQTSKVVTNGETYGELPKPTRPGHTFVGWSTSAGSDGKFITSVSKVNLSANQTLYAKWKANTLTYDNNGGTGTTPEMQTANSNGKVTLSSVVPVKDGYVFKGWGISTYSKMETYSPGETIVVPNTDTVASAIWYDESIPEEKVIIFTDDKTSVNYQYHVVSGYRDAYDKITYENGTINGVVSQNDYNFYDPIIYIPSLYFSANDYNYITVNAKIDIEGTEQNGMQIFFTTDGDNDYGESKSAWSWYSPQDENGYRDFTFQMYLNDKWDGTITSLRIDPFNDVPGSYSIKSVTLSYKSPVELKNNIILDKTLLNMKQGETATLNATANPADAEITWISTNKDVATVKDGVVTAVGGGSAAIIAKNYGEAVVEYISGETYTTDSLAYVSSAESIQVVANPFDKNDKVLYLETNQADKQAWTYFWYPCEYKPGQKYLVKIKIMPGNDFYGNRVNYPSVGVNIRTNGKDNGAGWVPIAYDEWTEFACVYTVPEDTDITKDMRFGIFANPSEVGDSEQEVSYSYYLDDIMVIPYDGNLDDGNYDGDSEDFTQMAAGCLVNVKAQYTVSYNTNGGSNAPEKQTWFDGEEIILSSQIPVRQGYEFLGWALSSTGIVELKPGANLAHKGNLTLYAIWEANKYTVSYNANGGEGAPSSQTKTHDVALTLSSTKPTRNGYTFLGWSTTENGSVEYAPGATYLLNGSVTLYAVWQLDTISVSGVSLNKTNATLTEGETLTLTATVNPSNATNKAVTWKSSNTSVATVVNGVVTAAGEGNAIITVTTVDGEKTATCTITVKAETPDYNSAIIFSDDTGKPGDEVNVVVSLKSKEEINTIGFSDIEYDKNILTFEKCTINADFKEMCAIARFDENRMTFVAALNETISEGEICTLTFRINENAEEGSTVVKSVTTVVDGKTESATCTITVESDAPIAYKATMTLSDVSGKPGDEVKVVVSLKAEEAINTIGFAGLEYDEDVLTFEKCTINADFKEMCAIAKFDKNQMTFVAAFKTEDDDGETISPPEKFDGEICTLTFRINENAEEGSVVVDTIASVKLNSTAVETEVVPATVTVRTQLLGDLNLDETVDMNDAILLLQYSMFPDLYPIDYLGSVDFTKDGSVDMNDAILLLQYSMFPDLYPME